jgi:oxygen-independent coproporphyrinogen III oxidase
VSPRHLYLHVPFCLRRCGYCDFAVTATRRPPVDGWLAAVAAELDCRARSGLVTLPLRPETVYVGGGTPSLLGAHAMARLRTVLERFATWSPAPEWTVEANPESFTADLARDWLAAGINRVSIGVQTFHDPALRWMGRLHGGDGARSAVVAARDAGLANVSIDLIFGLPAHLGRDWAADLDRAVALEPDHVSLYGLTAEPGTPLGRSVEAGSERLAGEERYAAEYLLAADRLSAAGLRHYEVSNFARPGAESRHNQAYWRNRAYLGLGPGAHSFLPPVRSWNVRDWAEYRERVMAGRTPEQGREELTEDDTALEAAWLGLRSDEGIPQARLTPPQQAVVDSWEHAGWAGRVDGRIRLTRSGWLLLDRLAVELDTRRG